MNTMRTLNHEQIQRGFDAMQVDMRSTFEGDVIVRPFGSILSLHRYDGKIIAHSKRSGWWSHRGEFATVSELQEWLDTRPAFLNR